MEIKGIRPRGASQADIFYIIPVMKLIDLLGTSMEWNNLMSLIRHEVLLKWHNLQWRQWKERIFNHVWKRLIWQTLGHKNTLNRWENSTNDVDWRESEKIGINTILKIRSDSDCGSIEGQNGFYIVSFLSVW